MPWDLYDYKDLRDKNIIAEWIASLDKQSQGKLDRKLDQLKIHGDKLSHDLLSDTPSPKIKKIRVNGRVALRPLLCKGPIRMEAEYTLLLGACERDRKFDPSNAISAAEENRQRVISQPMERRTLHDSAE